MRDWSMKRARVLLSLVTAYLVLGGSAAEADDPRAMQLTYGPWTKLCFKRADDNSDCFISAAARGACTPSGGGVSISIRDKKLLSLLVNFGTRRTLEGGISVQIDQDATIPISHPKCFGLGCRGKLDTDGKLIERLKRSRTIAIEATDAAHQKLSLSFSLADFAQAYDGPAGDPPKVRDETAAGDKMKQLMKEPEEQKSVQCEE
jgi:invasion protein IalB